METAKKFLLDKSRASLVVVDVQQKLVKAMPETIYRQTLKSIEFMVECARLLGMPVTVTEQYPRGLGHTVPELVETGPEKTVEKVSFGCCGEKNFVGRLLELGRPQVVVTGMEAHVCVYQTVLGLLEEGYDVHLVRDAIISRSKVDYENALELSRQAGAVVTTAETAVFQLVGTAAAAEFKPVSALVKERFANR